MSDTTGKTIKFKHYIGDPVKVLAINIIARVDAMSVDATGKSYRIIYWDDGTRNSVWVYDWEVTSCQEK